MHNDGKCMGHVAEKGRTMYTRKEFNADFRNLFTLKCCHCLLLVVDVESVFDDG